MGIATTRPGSTDDRPIYHPLDQLRGTIRKFVLIDGLLAAALFVLMWFWVGLALDYGIFKLTSFDWVQDAPRWLRGIALVTLVVVTLVILVTRVLVRMQKEFSYPALALVLEKRFPEKLGDRLITAVELADTKQMAKLGYSVDMIRHTIDEARERVAEVPVNKVFNWSRLKTKGIAIVAIGVLLMVVSFGLYAAFSRTVSPVGFGNDFYDVSMIWAERNLFVQNTPWPRRAFLEVVEPKLADHRIGRDATSPSVRVRAYEWVIADRHTWEGWRPARWSDLPRLTDNPPELTAVLPSPGTPNAVTITDPDPKLDDVAQISFDTGSAGDTLFASLRETAANPMMSRTFRKLDVPNQVMLTYSGVKTSGNVGLTREPSGDFTGVVGGLKETVDYTIRGEDFSTAPRTITLVPPPMLIELKRTEFRPAYEFYPAPLVNVAKPGEQPRFVADWKALRRLRQEFTPKNMSLTGDKSVITVPAGTDLVITGKADKALKSVSVNPKIGKFPGAAPGSPVSVPVDNDSFTISLKDKVDFDFLGFELGSFYAVQQNTEFEITMTDHDNVEAKKSVLIQVTDDKAPEVEFGIDVLRKSGNVYLCTPVARIPFLTESIVRDDKGLSQVEYEYTAAKLESATVVGFQGQAVAQIWASAPALPDLGSLFGTAILSRRADTMIRPETSLKSMQVVRYRDEYAGLPKDTLESLKRKLATPISDETAVAIKAVKFQDPLLDSFELERALPAIKVLDTSELQPRYRVDLNVVATDTNVEAGRKSNRNIEPVRLLIISEADLLAEMSKEEEQLIARLTDILKKIEEAKRKMLETATRFNSGSTPPDLFVSAQVRVLDLTQDLAKAKDMLTTASSDYKRLQREAIVNQCNRGYIDRMEAKTIKPIDAILQQRFPDTDRAIADVQTTLAAPAKPSQAQFATANAEIERLAADLKQIIIDSEDAASIDKFRNDLLMLITKQKEVTAALQIVQKRVTEALFLPSIATLPPITLAKGEKKPIKHAINWKVYDKDDLKVTLVAPDGSDLVLPKEVVIPNDGKVDNLMYDLQAGQKEGKFTIVITPAMGAVVRQEVVVK